MKGQPIENENPILAGIFILEELDTPEKEDVTYDDMVRCILSAQWRVGNGEEPYPAATHAIEDHFHLTNSTPENPAHRERDSEAMEKLRGEERIQLTRMSDGTWVVGMMKKTSGKPAWVWVERNRSTDLADAILQEQDDE